MRFPFAGLRIYKFRGKLMYRYLCMSKRKTHFNVHSKEDFFCTFKNTKSFTDSDYSPDSSMIYFVINTYIM